MSLSASPIESLFYHLLVAAAVSRHFPIAADSCLSHIRANTPLIIPPRLPISPATSRHCSHASDTILSIMRLTAPLTIRPCLTLSSHHSLHLLHALYIRIFLSLRQVRAGGTYLCARSL